MTSRNWVKLFINTLVIGGLTTGVTGFIVRWNEFERFFTDMNIGGVLSVFIWMVGVGLIFSLLSQMGFFAYLTIHRFGLGIFKSVRLWNWVQLLFIALVIFDLVYLRYQAFAKEGESLFWYVVLAIFVLAFGLLIAWFKMKQTNSGAFIPALFFMVVATVLEWVPVLRVNDKSWLYVMLIPLLICNAYQLLMLHKLNEKSMEERRVLADKKAVKTGKDKINNTKKSSK